MAKKQTFFFEFLNQISFKKDPNFYNDETSKDWNSWMILRYLSMDQNLLLLISSIQEFQTVLDGKELYDFLCAIIPKQRRFFKYIKGVKEIPDKSLQWICKLYGCSKKEAQEYVDILGASWSEDIQKSFGEIDTPKKSTSSRSKKR